MNTPSIENDDLQNRHRQAPGEHTVQLPKRNTCPSEEEYVRAFVQLQQKTQSLEIEIAERKAVQERLRVLAAIVESSDDALFSKDLDGIGLTICQEIVKHHRGRIWVEREVGKGATFYLGLPRLQEELQGAR